jgi:hypothetical protein
MNPFYKNYQNNGQTNQGFNFQTALQNLARQIMPTGMTPEQIVRMKIQNGEMTQAQFQQLSAMADQLTGRNR